MFYSYYLQLDTTTSNFLNILSTNVLENFENLDYLELKHIRSILKQFRKETIRKFEVILHYSYANIKYKQHLSKLDKLDCKIKKQIKLVRPLYKLLLEIP